MSNEMPRNLTVLKALIENSLRREMRPIHPEEIRVMVGCLSAALPDRVYVIADSGRFCDDFSMAIRKRCIHLHNPDNARGLDNASVVILQTGPRTQLQQQKYNQLLDALQPRRNITLWRIGEWR